jgi:outer membrane usher protein
MGFRLPTVGLISLSFVFSGACSAQAQTLPSDALKTGSNALVVPMQLPIRDYVAQIRVNGSLTNLTVPLVRVDGLGWLMALEDFKQLRLVNAKASYAVRGDQELISLDRTKGIAVVFNERQVELNITAGVSQFEASRVDAKPEKASASLLNNWGGYLNYEATAAKIKNSDFVVPSAAASTELVLFSPWGSLVHQHIAARSEEGKNSSARLDTFFQRDFPDSGLRLRLGDNVSSAGSWGRSVRFAGLKLGTDFSLRPDFVSLPGVSVTGAAAVPSVVDVFVNGSLQGRYNIPAGQFSVDRVPVVSGAGTVRMVVRNALGLEQTIEAPFFRIGSQLEQGVSDYSIEVGLLREQFATNQSNYTDRVAIANWRYGLTQSLTTELRAEYGKKNNALGFGLNFPLAGAHAFSPSIAFSQNEIGQRGWSGLLGYSFSGQALRFAARLERNSTYFGSIGSQLERPSPSQRVLLSGGYRFSQDSDLGFAYTDSKERSGVHQTITSLNASTKLLRNVIVSGSLSRVVFEQASSNSASVQLYWFGDGPLYGSLSHQVNNERNRASQYDVLRLGSSMDSAGGASWELEAATQQRLRARASYLGTGGQISLEHRQQNSDVSGNQSTQRITATGSIVAAGGSIVPARTIDDSFILVQAEPGAGASVLRSGGRAEQLDRNGNLVINRVQPYSENTIRVNAENLDLDVTLGSPNLKAAVRSRAGGVVQLGVKRSLPVTFTLIFKGAPVSVNAKVTVNGSRVVVGDQGLIYLPEAQQVNQLVAETTSGTTTQSCTARFELKGAEVMADLGKIVCE